MLQHDHDTASLNITGLFVAEFTLGQLFKAGSLQLVRECSTVRLHEYDRLICSNRISSFADSHSYLQKIYAPIFIVYEPWHCDGPVEPICGWHARLQHTIRIISTGFECWVRYSGEFSSAVRPYWIKTVSEYCSCKHTRTCRIFSRCRIVYLQQRVSRQPKQFLM